MNIHTIKASCLGPFVEPVKIDSFESGLNIVAADNEEGKSTLVKGAARALFDRHSCKSDEIKALQPVGTDLAPEIEVEFSNSDGRFRIWKRFLNRSESRLYRWENTGFSLISDGDAADKRMVELLRSDVPGRGATKPAHWGMLRYLWARQDEVPSWPDWAGQAGNDVQSSLAKIEIDRLVERLHKALKYEYLEAFTPTGQVKKNGQLHRVESELNMIEEQLFLVREKRLAVEADEEEYRRLIERVATLEEQLAESDRESVALQKRNRKAELLKKDIDAFEKAYAESKSDLEAVTKDLERRDQWVVELNDAKADPKHVGDHLKSIAKEETLLKQAVAEEAKHRREFAQRRTEIRQRLSAVSGMLKIRQADEQCARAREILNYAAEREKERRALELRRAKLPEISPAKLKKVQKLSQKSRDLSNRLVSVGLSIRLLPEKNASIKVVRPESEEVLALSSEEIIEILAAREARLELNGWGAVEVTSGAAEGSELERMNADLKKVFDALGVDSVVAMEAAFDEGRKLDREIRSFGIRMKDILGQYESVDGVSKEVARQETDLESLKESIQVPSNLADLATSELHAKQARLEVADEKTDEKIEAVEKALEKTRTSIEELHGKRDQLLKDQNDFRVKRSGLEAKLGELKERYPGDIESSKTHAGSTFVQAEARRNEALGNLPADWKKLPDRLERAVRTSAALKINVTKIIRHLDELKGKLRSEAHEGLYAKETALTEELESRRSNAGSIRQRAAAAGFLVSLMGFRKSEAVERVLRPLENQLSAQFAELTGYTRRRVFLDESLQIEGVGRTRNETIPFSCLSQGAKEQLLLALRAAVAVELAANEPQIVILDDVLVNTDPTRQKRVLDFLDDLSNSVQILVLTCHPDRYRGVGNKLGITRLKRVE